VASKIFQNICILIIISHLSIKWKELSFLTHASFQQPRKINHYMDFIQSAHVHSHIPTHNAPLHWFLIITFQIRHFSMVCWVSSNFSPPGLFVHIHYYSRTMSPSLRWSWPRSNIHLVKLKYHMNAFQHSFFINNQGANAHGHLISLFATLQLR